MENILRGVPPRQALEEAWHLFHHYDQSAGAAQRRFLHWRQSLLISGVVATALVVAYDVLECQGHLGEGPGKWLLWYAVLAATVAVGLTAAGSSRFDRGQGWVELRATAEALKREIYRYRTRVGRYAGAGRDAELSARVEELTGLEAPPRAAGSPTPSPGGEDLSGLDADGYLEERLEDQLVFYRRRVGQFGRRLARGRRSIAFFGALGIAAVLAGWEDVLPLTIVAAASIGAWLELRRLETTTAGYQRAARELDEVRGWWRSSEGPSIDRLVARTEAVLQVEGAGWQREMQEALTDLYSRDSRRLRPENLDI